MAKTKRKKEAETPTASGTPQPAKKAKKRQQTLKGPNGGNLLVLIEDVPHLGKVGDQVEVRPGYARNYLLPNGMAVVPTPHDLKMLERHQIKVQKAREARIADLKVLAEQLSRMTTITIEAQTNAEGHLYGSIGAVEISKTLKGKNLLVEPEMIRLEQPIKEANTLNEVKLVLGFSIEANIQVLVVGVQQTPAKR